MGTSYKDIFKLYDVIQNGSERTLESLLKESPVQINQIIPCKGIGILHLAVGIEPEEKSKKCTELLLKHGGDPNLCNDDGVTPVHIAAIWGRLDNLKLLIGCGGDPSRRDLDGHSAFEYAAREEQWHVVDYLHNVVDQADHLPTPHCAYTLHLERVSLTTDQIVAEYGPIDDNTQEPVAPDRKSGLINEWCEKNSLCINKLYPTIMGDTYLLDDDSEPWRNTRLDLSHDLTIDLTHDRTSSDTHASFKSCLSNKLTDVQISGIQRLDFTLDETTKENSNILNKRISVYENFSLPGSPKMISHINYNTKTSLKKKKQQQGSRGGSLMSSDSSPELDEVLAVVQNKTNEYLSASQVDALQNKTHEYLSASQDARNTRRSSASSGVSSASSSVVLARVHEHYRYEDEDEDVVLIEKRLLVSPLVLSVEEGEGAGEAAADQSRVSRVSAVSVASSLPAALRHDDAALRAELLRLGCVAGPVQHTTRTLYLKKLQLLRRQAARDTRADTRDTRADTRDTRADTRDTRADTRDTRADTRDTRADTRDTRADTLAGDLQALSDNDKRHKKVYSIEIEKSLRDGEWMQELSEWAALELQVRQGFAAGGRWREGGARTSFSYLLLDPRHTRDLPARAHAQRALASWNTFIDAIFYVGKGKRSRPYAHLYQALTLWKKDFRTSKDKKVQHILDIWSAQAGVVCLHIFQNVLPAEAYTHEAAMIDALGLGALRNVRAGNYYGAAAAWPLRTRRQLGVYLLYRAMLIFLSEGERQLRPDDLH